MKTNERALYVCLFIFAVLVLTGFYITLDKIASLRGDVQNMGLSLEIMKQGGTPAVSPTTQQNPPAEKQPAKQNEQAPITSDGAIRVPAGIVYEIQPGTNPKISADVLVNVDGVSKDGSKLAVEFKAFASETTDTISIDPSELVQIVKLDSENEKPSKVEGSFNAIPPNTAVSGTLTFTIDASDNTVILQVGIGDSAKFYEFNFLTKSYKEVAIG
jgi:hypothetical protein